MILKALLIEPILTRCGYRWDLCLAFRPNVCARSENRQELSDGWHKYFGFRLPPQQVVCDGRMAEDPTLIDQSCPVRPCVIARGLENCAPCDQYLCARMTERLDVLEKVQRRFGAEIPPGDRLCFIEPYENRARLETIRRLRPPTVLVWDSHPPQQDCEPIGYTTECCVNI